MTVDQQHTKSISRWVTGFVAVLVVGLLGGTAFGSLAHAAGPADNDGPVTTAVECGPTDHYNHELDEARQAVARKAESQYPDTYGRTWTETGNPENGIFLSFSEDAEGKVAELAEDFACPDLLIAVNINYSAKEMFVFRDRVRRDRDRARRGQAPLGHATKGFFSIGTYINEAVIDVSMPRITKRIIAAFKSEYGARGVRFKIKGSPTPFPYPFFNDGYKGLTIAIVQRGFPADDVEHGQVYSTGKSWSVRLKHLNHNLRQTMKRFKRVKLNGSSQQVRKLKRRIVKKRLRKQRLRRTMWGLPWPVQPVRR